MHPGLTETCDGIDNNCDGDVAGEELSPCPEDVNGDGSVTVADVLDLLSDFGCLTECATDVDGDGAVSVSDVLTVLSAFGQPC